jgi:predicted esterase
MMAPKEQIMNEADPHSGGTVLATGAALDRARAAMIMVHGRGADAADILALSEVFERPDIAYLAPQAANHSWYPRPFVAPVEANEPNLSSALKVIATLLAKLAGGGLKPDKVMLLGFSQGACLSLEFAARNPMRYGAVCGLSGGLIGATVNWTRYQGSLQGTPVFLGCSDVDMHIPLERVKESSAVMRELGGDVTEEIYPGMGHTINEAEVAHVRRLIEGIAGPAEAGG